MRLPAEGRARSKAEALRKIATSGESELGKFYLAETVQTYLELSGEQESEHQKMLEGEDMKEAATLLNPWKEEGRIEGKAEGQSDLLLSQLAHRFGKLSGEAAVRVRAMSPEERKALSIALLSAGSLEELGLGE